MKLKTLTLTHYRNYETAELNFSDEVNIFIGINAQGKTNLLEAIYCLAMAKSHRTSNDKELISGDMNSVISKVCCLTSMALCPYLYLSLKKEKS